MKTFIFSTLLALSAVLHGADLAPELAPLAAKYKADSDGVTAKRSAAVSQVAQNYIMALNTAERTATSTGDLKSLAAISSERDGIKAGNLDPKLPDNLPKDLPTPRKRYMTEVERVDADIKAQRQRVTAAYLQALAALQSRSSAKPALLGQIEAEKKKLIGGPKSTLSVELAGTKWRIENSDQIITLQADGTTSISWSNRKGWWKVTGANEISWDMRATPMKEKLFINDEATQIKFGDGRTVTRINQ